MTYNKQIGEDIRKVRLSLGLTQEAFAERFNELPDGLKTSRTDIVKYENGATKCPADKYVKFLNLSKL